MSPKTKHIHKFRQSWLNDVIKCPEQARMKRMGELDHLPSVQSDSMSLGTATHAGIEEWLKVKRESRMAEKDFDYATLRNQCEDVIIATLDTFLAEGGWTETYSTRVEKVFDGAIGCFDVWLRDIEPHVEPQQIEAGFEILFHEDDVREIWLTGTADCVDVDGVVWDWKTSGREYTPWEMQRWAIQPSVYCHAFGADEFKYGLMVRDTQRSQILSVRRSEGTAAWLRAQCENLASLIESNADTWPLNDAGWWCSPKWCPAWAECKGIYVDADGGWR